MIFVLNMGLISAQDNEIIDYKNLSHTIYGGTNVDFYIVDEQLAVVAGFQAGWAYKINDNQYLGIGAIFNRLINKVEAQRNYFGDRLYLDLMYIGLGFTYTYEFKKPVSFTVMNDFVTGLSNYHFGNFESEMQTGYTVYMMKPGILFNYDITRNISLSKGLHYKLVSSSDHFLISSKQLSGLTGTLRLTIKKML